MLDRQSIAILMKKYKSLRAQQRWKGFIPIHQLKKLMFFDIAKVWATIRN